MKRSALKILCTISFISIGFVLLFVGVSLYTHQESIKKSSVVDHIFSKRVEQNRPLIEKYATEYEVADHVDVLLAMMMQESGGRGDDPMQSSESLCGEVGCITDKEESIEQGVSYFSKILEVSNGDLELTVQAYNFGIGFVDYVQAQGDDFDQEMAISFSQKMYSEAEDPSKYSCLREEAKQYDACYGDIYYARDVMAYEQRFAKN